LPAQLPVVLSVSAWVSRCWQLAVIGGGLIARLAVTAVSKLFGKKNVMLKQSDIDPAAAAKKMQKQPILWPK
jgi:ornithine cyclodeaminase/alanine dehydrogenase-like protein (mu-crystallin family)